MNKIFLSKLHVDAKATLWFLALAIAAPVFFTCLYTSYLTQTLDFDQSFTISESPTQDELSFVNGAVALKSASVLKFIGDSIDNYDRIGAFTKISPDFIRFNISIHGLGVNFVLTPQEKNAAVTSAILASDVECTANGSSVNLEEPIVSGVKLSASEIGAALSVVKCVVTSRSPVKDLPFDPSLHYSIKPAVGGGIEIAPDKLSFFFAYLIALGLELAFVATIRELVRVSRKRSNYFFESKEN
jgi:hypothetical protein